MNKKKKEVFIGHADLLNTEKGFIRLQTSCFPELCVFFKCRTDGPEENITVQIIPDLDLDRRNFRGTWSVLADAIAEHTAEGEGYLAQK